MIDLAMTSSGKTVPPRPSAGGIVLNTQADIVLVNQWANSWSFPKGRIEAGESALQAAVREIAEETGIVDLRYIKELGSYERYSIGPDGVGEVREWGMRTRTLFLFKTSASELVPRDEEVTEARFVPIDEALALLTHPTDREFLARMRSAIEAEL